MRASPSFTRARTMILLGVLVVLSTAMGSQDWTWGPNAPKPPGDLSTELTRRLLLGLATPAESKDAVVLYGGLSPESGRHDLGGSKSEWWVWCGVEPDGTVAGIALSDRRPSRGASDTKSFVRIDPRETVDMPVINRRGGDADKRRKMRLITHVLDPDGRWQAIDSNKAKSLADRDPDRFMAVVLDLLDLD
ncbi:MAG: hypothetical protein RLZZ461_69 [Planctomycetota bacterium]